MIKKLLLLFILLVNSVYAQERLITSKGEITFEASVAFLKQSKQKIIMYFVHSMSLLVKSILPPISLISILKEA